MNSKSVKMPLACKVLVLLQVFLGIGAVYGGMALVLDRSGGLLGMPIVILQHSPFDSFLLPGLILMLVLGIMPLLIVYGLVLRPDWGWPCRLNIFPEKHWAWTYSLYTGFMLIGWITIQLHFLQGVGTIQLVYILLGLVIQANTLLPSVQGYFAFSNRCNL